MLEVSRKSDVIPPSHNPGIGHRGPITLDLGGTDYSADIYYKTPYIAEKDELVRITEGLIVKSGLWNPDVAKGRILAIVERSDPRKTSWIGFRKSDTPRGQYEGATWQEILPIPTVRGDKKPLFMILRVFIQEAQGKHMGRISMPLALNTHYEDEPTHIVHRTGSPAAVRAWLESGVFKPKRRFPRDLSFMEDPLAIMLLIGIYELTHVNGRFPNLSTGISIGEYSGPNTAYIPDPNHAPTMEIRQWMVEKLKMNFLRGDALTEIGELK